jgi:hypothetical protein
MDSLSWLIYIAGVSENLLGLGIFCTAMVFLLNVVIAIRNQIVSSDDYIYRRQTSPLWNYHPKLAIIPLIMLIIVCIIPNTKTVTLIAASQLGEAAITNNKTQQIIDPGLDYIKVWLTKKTEELKKETK